MVQIFILHLLAPPALIYEDVAASIPLETFINNKETGYQIRFDGRSGNTIVNMPALYIQAFLQKYNELMQE